MERSVRAIKNKRLRPLRRVRDEEKVAKELLKGAQETKCGSSSKNILPREKAENLEHDFNEISAKIPGVGVE